MHYIQLEKDYICMSAVCGFAKGLYFNAFICQHFGKCIKVI